MKYVCDVCGWVFDEKICDPDHGIDAGVSFDELPEDFQCPLCGGDRIGIVSEERTAQEINLLLIALVEMCQCRSVSFGCFLNDGIHDKVSFLIYIPAPITHRFKSLVLALPAFWAGHK